MNLIDVALLRAEAAQAGIKEINQRESRISFTMHDLPLEAVSGVVAEPAFRGRVYFSAGQTPLLTLRLQKNEDPLRATRDFITRYRACMNPKEQ